MLIIPWNKIHTTKETKSMSTHIMYMNETKLHLHPASTSHNFVEPWANHFNLQNLLCNKYETKSYKNMPWNPKNLLQPELAIQQ